MTKSLLGLHWIRTHPDGRDLSHVERMQYPSVKLFEWHWSDRNACADLLSVLPKDAYILARDHPLSEQSIWNDPVGTGTRHANEWAMKVAEGRVHVPVERTFFLGRNEPDATTGDRNAIDLYTAAFLDRLQVHGLRGGAFNFSTGHPRTVDGTGNTLADYTVFERSHQAIVRGRHIGVLHIYGTAATPCAPGHFDRLKACSWQDVEWVVGEMGADEHVVGGGNHDGFLISMRDNPARYCQWLDQLIMGINDSRIHSYQVFTHDFSHPWSSFDIRPIRDALESYDWQHVKQQPPKPDTPLPTKPHEVHLPQVGSGPQPAPAIAYVSAPAGLRLRTQPSTDGETLTIAPFGAQVRIVGVAQQDGWIRASYDGRTGWMSSQYITLEPPTPSAPQPPTPPTKPTGDNWPRSRAFVAKWEGGYQNNPADKGNWTGCEVGKGENRGTKFGISACSYPELDIPNLSIQEADAIYERDYWRASGADKLPWPYCLIVFDTAVLHGVGTARQWQAEVGNNAFAFAAKRLRVYTKLDNWHEFGVGWVNRVANLLEEASK